YLPVFLSWFVDSGIDFRLGVVPVYPLAADLVAENGSSWVDRATPEPLQTFATMAQASPSSPTAYGLANVFLALQPKLDGFLRDGAALSTIVVSDRDDHTAASVIPLDQFVGWYADLRVPAERSFSAIVNVADPAPEIGARYLSVSDAVGGL